MKHKQSPKEMITELKEKEKQYQQYQQVRIRQEVYDEFAKIAEEEGITFPGKIIHLALEKWLDEYRSES